LVLVA